MAPTRGRESLELYQNLQRVRIRGSAKCRVGVEDLIEFKANKLLRIADHRLAVLRRDGADPPLRTRRSSTRETPRGLLNAIHGRES
jgi:hypothetical protein